MTRTRLLIPVLAVLLTGCAGQATDPPRTERKPTTTTAPPSTSEAVTDDWRTVTFQNAAYDVPTDWTVRTGTFSDGRTFDQPVYRPGYCEGHENSYLAIVYLGASPSQDVKGALDTRYQQILDTAFAGRSPSIERGEPSGDPENNLGQGAIVTATPKGPCEAEKTAVYLAAVKYPGANGCFLFEVWADQNVPDAVPETTVARIVGSLRVTGT